MSDRGARPEASSEALEEKEELREASMVRGPSLLELNASSRDWAAKEKPGRAVAAACQQ